MAVLTVADSLDSIVGSTAARIFTPPRRRLTSATTDGFEVIKFARDVLKQPLDPWQEWLVVHMLEKLEDGRPRFRRLLILVPRQAGKTTLLSVLACWWLWRDDRVRLLLGLSASEDTAREAWDLALGLAESNDFVISKVVTTNGRVSFTAETGARYRIKAANRRGGRGWPLDRVIADELREQHNRDSYNATYPAMNARRFAQWIGISNAGDDTAVVLWSLYDEAIKKIGNADTRIGLFEWSADPALAVDDPRAWIQAQPQLGRRVGVEEYAEAAAHAAAVGGQDLADFETEWLCRRVQIMNPAINAGSWDTKCFEASADINGRPAAVMDLSPDQRHATLTAAWLLPSGRYRVEPVEAWEGPGAGDRGLRELPTLLRKINARHFGWLPDGPMAALLAGLKPRPGWPPRGITAAPIRGETPAVCMGLAELVAVGGVSHGADPLQDAHVKGAERLPRPGGTWIFSRKGGHCDAAYAAAGAVHLARSSPVVAPRLRVLTSRSGRTLETPEILPPE